MTCYETLRAPAPAADAPMAYHFVKWWRNKFRNGYKKFSVGTESERTDTEELVCRAASQCSAPPDLLPSEARALLQPATPLPPRTPSAPRACPPPSPKPHQDNQQAAPRLRFEELTCDVELQHSESSKQQPLQFSFTLYDLDGHGRMTKDDIAGIVSTIYESIGKSVTVPHYGSKTIQVRLTVVPEDGCSRKEAREARRQRRRRGEVAPATAPAPPADCGDCSDDERRSRLSLEDDASSCSSEPRAPQPPPPQPPRPARHARREPRSRKHTKKRSGSLQRRELLEIIQANMEKNHLSFQTARKPCDRVVNEEEIAHKYQKLRNRAHTVSERPTNTFHKTKTECSGNGYLDLAAERGDSNLCRYDRYLHAVICSSARHATTGYHHRQPRGHRNRGAHVRSRSHDVPAAAPAPPPSAPQSPRARHAPPTHPRVLQIIFL